MCRRRALLGQTAASELNRFVVWLALPALLFDITAHSDWSQLANLALVVTFSVVLPPRSRRDVADDPAVHGWLPGVAIAVLDARTGRLTRRARYGSIQLPGRQRAAHLLAQSRHGGCLLALALCGGLFICHTGTQLFDQAGAFDRTAETPECNLDGLIGLRDNSSQIIPLSSMGKKHRTPVRNQRRRILVRNISESQ